MYSGAGPIVIKESLRGLLIAAGTLSRIARFYGTPERMTTLLGKVTNQMMKACRWEVGAKQGRMTARILHWSGPLSQVPNCSCSPRMPSSWRQGVHPGAWQPVGPAAA
jgi:hypothetical protein